MKATHLAGGLAVVALVLFAAPVLAQQGPPPCPADASNASTGNLTATFAVDQEPPTKVFDAHEVQLGVSLASGEGTPDEVDMSVVVSSSPMEALDMEANVPVDEDEPVNLSFPAADVLGEDGEADIHLCANHEPLHDRAGDRLDGTLERLDDYDLEALDPRFEPHSPAGDAPTDLPTTESNASFPFKRNLSAYAAVEERKEVHLVTEARPAGDCSGQAPEPRVLLEHNRTRRVDVDLSEAPACEVTFAFTARLDEDVCAQEDCDVSAEVSRTLVVHRPWELRIDEPSATDAMMAERVWAPENDELPKLQSAFASFRTARVEAYEAYEQELDGESADTARIGNAQATYEASAADVRDRFAAAEELDFVDGLAEAEDAFASVVATDRGTFEESVSTYVEGTYDTSGDGWWTVRQWFAYGFGPALVASFVGFLLFTRRWRKKTEYWSMFSSKASFTHPLHAAAGVAAVGIGAALTIGIVHDGFTLHRILGIPADLWRLIG